MDRVAIIILTAVILLTGCKESSEPPVKLIAPAPTTTIGEIKKLYKGKLIRVSEPMVVVGRVVSNDKENNFYNSIIIEQDGAAVEILAASDALYARYPEGYSLTLSLEGLAISSRNGVLQVGVESDPWEYYELTELSTYPMLNRHLFRGERVPFVEPPTLHLEELSPDMCGRYIRIKALRFEPEEIDPEKEYTLSGYLPLKDTEGRTMYSYVSDYARFSDRVIEPMTTLSIEGCLLYYESGAHKGFIIKPNSGDDIEY